MYAPTLLEYSSEWGIRSHLTYRQMHNLLGEKLKHVFKHLKISFSVWRSGQGKIAISQSFVVQQAHTSLECMLPLAFEVYRDQGMYFRIFHFKKEQQIPYDLT